MEISSRNRSIILFVFLFFNGFTNAQIKTCDCGNDFEFLANSYIKDYSGFQDFSKLHPDYLKTINKLAKQAKSIKYIQTCDSIIKKLITYINNGHVVYGQTKENPYFESSNTNHLQVSLSPTLNFLNNETVLLEIKTCDLYYKPLLDSLLLTNEKKLSKTKHFIIDLRGNEGGGDATFDLLVPYLYTNPILIHTAQLWASENNIKLFESFLTNPEIPLESKLNIQKIVDKARNNPLTFVPLSDNKVDTLVLDSVMEYPKKVSIIIDRNCKSSTEQFLLLVKQSRKTVIYGKTNSGGALDYSNLNFIVTPSSYWYASVPTTKTTRLPENPVDPNGIKPDQLIDGNRSDIIKWILLK